MPAHLSVLVVLTILVPFAKTAFDCNKIGEDTCMHSAECQYFGNCKCLNNEFVGHQCQLYSHEITSGAKCTVKCENGGTCYRNDKCACPYEFVGDLCEHQRTGVRCHTGELEVVAYRNLAYDGYIYIAGQKQNCTLIEKKESDINGWKKYALRIDLFNPTPSVCMPKKVVDPTTGTSTYTLELATTYSNGGHPREFLHSNKDTFTQHSCTYQPVIEKHGRTVEIANYNYLVNLTAVDPGKNKSVNALKENATVHLLFTPNNVKDLEGVMVHSLEIYSFNNITMVKREIIRDGCINEELNKSIGPLENISTMIDGKPVAKVVMKSFILIKNKPLLFQHQLKFCNGPCPNTVCSFQPI